MEGKSSSNPHRRVSTVDFPEFDGRQSADSSTVELEEIDENKNKIDSWNQQTKNVQKRTPLRYRAAQWVNRSSFGQANNIFQILISLFACIIYVWETYLKTIPVWMTYTDLAIACFFALDLLLYFAVAEDRIKFLFSLGTLVDILSIIPAILEAIDPQSINYFIVIRILRLMRLLRGYRIFNLEIDGVKRVIVNIAFSILCLVWLSTGIINLIELQDTNSNGEEYPFHSTFYFIVITIATVGYGDITPRTTFGRMLVTALILTAAAMLPIQVSRLIESLSQNSPYDGSYNESSKHVILCGHTTVANIKDFLNEFFKQAQRLYIKVIILTPDLQQSDILSIIKNPRYEDKVVYLRGSPLYSSDLKRARADRAIAAFILSEYQSTDPDSEDKAILMETYSFKKFNPKLKMFVQLIKPENKPHIHRAGVTEVYSINEFKLGLLSKSLLYPGLSTLISNLIRTPSLLSYSIDDLIWKKEYVNGRNQQIFEFTIPYSFEGLTFSEMVFYVYKRWRVIIFALQIRQTNYPYISMNPGNKYTLRGGEIAYMIASQTKLVQEVANFSDNLAPEQINLDMNKIEPSDAEPEETQKSEETPSFFPEKLNVLRRSQQRNMYSSSKNSFQPISSVNKPHLDPPASDHIIIVGSIQDLPYVILPLRSRLCAKPRDIVILHSTMPSEAHIKELEYLKGIYFVKGSALSAYDLQRAGIGRASSVLIRMSEKSVSHSVVHLRDSDALLTFINIETHIKSHNLNILVEVVSDNNMKFLSPRPPKPLSKHDIDLLFNDKFFETSYVSGRAFASSVLNNLLVKSFFAPSIVPILRLFIAHEVSELQLQSLLLRIDVPNELKQKPFIDVFQSCLQNNILPLALLRFQDNRTYIYTNPEPHHVVRKDDKLFVLSLHAGNATGAHIVAPRRQFKLTT